MVNSKERAFLKKMAHDMDPSFRVGKSIVIPEIIEGISEALEKRELVKVKVLDNCMMDIKEVADIISGRTRSEVIQIIGRRFVLFRKSKTNSTINLPK